METLWIVDGDSFPNIYPPIIIFLFIGVLGEETKISHTILVRDIRLLRLL